MVVATVPKTEAVAAILVVTIPVAIAAPPVIAPSAVATPPPRETIPADTPPIPKA